MLHDHRVLTIEQITQLAFDSRNAAQHRLLILYRHRVLDRFRPYRDTGSAPFHYVLDEMGAAILAAHQGISVDQLGYRRDHALAIAHSQRLTHTVGVNGFFTALAAAAHASRGRAQLAAWWSERRCAAAWGHTVRPDGYGRWRHHHRQVEFFLEYDRGTEPLHRLVAKLHAYTELAAATGITTPTLLWLPGPRREAHLHGDLEHQHIPIPVATASGGHPAERIWLQLGDPDRRRLPLTHLT
jgi:hypothetical protein